MTNIRRSFKFVVAGLFVLGAFAGLMRLGFWQLERLAWKEDLLARMAAYKAQDVDLSAYVEDEGAEFRRGHLTGRWDETTVFRTKPRIQDGMIGYWVVSTLELDGGRGVMVNRGWVADGQEAPVLDMALPRGLVTVRGTLRRPGVLEDYRHDAGLSPWVLFMEGSTPADHTALTPVPVVAKMNNDHRQYAIFWFSMAGMLLVLAGVGAFSLRGRRSAS